MPWFVQPCRQNKTYLSDILLNFFKYLAHYSVNSIFLQKLFSSRNRRDGQRAGLLAAILLSILGVLHVNDIFSSESDSNLYKIAKISTKLALFISYFSTVNLTISNLLINDLIKPLSTFKSLIFSRIFIIFYTILCIVLAYLLEFILRDGKFGPENFTTHFLLCSEILLSAWLPVYFGTFTAAIIPTCTKRGFIYGNLLSFIVNSTIQILCHFNAWSFCTSETIFFLLASIFSFTITTVISLLERITNKNPFRPEKSSVITFPCCDKLINKKILANYDSVGDINAILRDTNLSISFSSFRNYSVEKAFEEAISRTESLNTVCNLPRAVHEEAL